MNTQTYTNIKKYLRGIIRGSEFENNVFAVGGCVRDWLMNRTIKDMDLVVSLENGGIRFAEWLEASGYTKGTVVTYPRFGTAMFKLKEFPDEDLEVVQTRTETYDSNSRKPETAYGSLQQDCLRRDLTINAIYEDISSGKILDVCGKSYDDLKNEIIRTPCDPDQTYIDDPLRILRCVRFANRFKWEIEANTAISMVKNINRLSVISKERIQDEFLKIIKDDPNGFIMLVNCQAYKYIFPNFEPDYGFLEGIKKVGKFSMPIKLAFFGYFNPNMESDMRTLKFSVDDIKHVMDIVNLTKFLSNVKNIRDRREFCYKCKTINRYQEVVILSQIIESATFDKWELQSDMIGYKLPVTGDDIMNVLNIGPCKRIKEVQDILMEFVFQNGAVDKSILIDEITKLK